MLFSCFTNVVAGNIELHRENDWCGGWWVNDWTNPPHFYQTKYKDGWNGNYKTRGNTGEYEVVFKSMPGFFIMIIPFYDRVRVINYDGSDMTIKNKDYGRSDALGTEGRAVKLWFHSVRYLSDTYHMTERVTFDCAQKKFLEVI